MTEDEIDNWMASPNLGDEVEESLGVGDGQGRNLACTVHEVSKSWTQRRD